MDDELLTWLGNFLNFLILTYFTLKAIKNHALDYAQILITSFGLLISIFIHLKNIIKR